MIGSVEVALLILLAIIIAGPILAERLKIPGLIGLIFLGMVVGPFMLGWVRSQGLPVLVFSSDVEAVQARVNKDPGVEVTKASGGVQAALDLATKDDLVIVPAHVLASARSFGPWRLMRGLRDISLMVVAGPHRLSVARSSVQRYLHGIVDATDQTYGSQQSTVNS